MPESVIPDQYADQIPRFTLPKEFTNPPPETKAPETPAEAPKEPKPVAEAATTPPETPKETPGKETEGKDPEEKEKGTSRYLKRIERAHRERAEAQAAAEAQRRENEQLKEQLKQVKSPVPSGAPRMEDFTDVQEYAKAFAAFEKDNALKDYQRKQAEEAATAQRTKLEQDWAGKVSKAIAKYDDFEEVVGDLKPVTPWGYTLLAAESGEEVAYYLGKHPKEADVIFSKPPLLQAYEIGRLEAKLLSKPEAPKEPSKAPAPIAPVTGAAAAPSGEYRPGMPFEEYRKIGNKMFRGR